MSLLTLIEFLFWHTWWRWEPLDRSPFSIYYHWFNLAEGTVWVALAIYVLARYLRRRKSVLELCYAAAFLTFGVSDFVEAHALTSWLLWLKLVNLIALFRLGWIVERRFYPPKPPG